MVTLRVGSRTFGDDDLVVMAIVNRTPDSFHHPGATYGFAQALEAVDRAVDEGADIVDIGGVKAGPGPPVPSEEEIRRVVEMVAEVRDRHPTLPISVDTWRSSVADAAVAAGADMINDTWSGTDPEVAQVAADRQVGLVCSHTGGLKPRTDPHRIEYDDVTADIRRTVVALAERALALGVPKEAILIDPTHDFGKNTRHSLEATRRLPELVDTGWPVLVSVSHKDFIGETLDLPAGGRLAGTTATLAISAWLGARVFRVHDVAPARQALDMVSSIRGTRQPAVSRRGVA